LGSVGTSYPGGTCLLDTHGPAAESADSDASTLTTTNEPGSTRRRRTALNHEPPRTTTVQPPPYPDSLSLYEQPFEPRTAFEPRTTWPVSTHKKLSTQKAPHTKGSFSLSTRSFYHAGPRPLAPPCSRLARPFWACLFPLGQSGQRTRPPLVKVTGGRSRSCAWRTCCLTLLASSGPKNLLSLLALWCGVLAGNRAALAPRTALAGVTGGKTHAPWLFPVAPAWRSCPHGAR